MDKHWQKKTKVILKLERETLDCDTVIKRMINK